MFGETFRRLLHLVFTGDQYQPHIVRADPDLEELRATVVPGIEVFVLEPISAVDLVASFALSIAASPAERVAIEASFLIGRTASIREERVVTTTAPRPSSPAFYGA